MPSIVGHRGARNLWPENSVSGFRKLAALPVEAVEFDVHQTSDGQTVVIHDPTLERTTHGSGAVGTKTVAEITATRLRDAGDECVPTLDAVLEALKPTSLQLHVEIKTDVTGTPYPGLERRLIETLRRHGVAERSIITCFALEVIETVRGIWPDTAVLVSLDRRSAEAMGGIVKALDRLSLIPGCIVAVEKGLLAVTLPLCLERIGTERLDVWIPNEPEEIAYWLRQPVGFLTTDRPDIAVALRDRQAAAP